MPKIKIKNTLKARVLKHVKDNPGSTYATVAQAMGLEESQTSNVLHALYVSRLEHTEKALAPGKLPEALLEPVAAMREAGATWPEITAHLKAEHGLVFHHSSLRRAWRHRLTK